CVWSPLFTTAVSSSSFRYAAGRAVSFFFQAEDGIRDLYVTGVQTCALPIWPRGGVREQARHFGRVEQRHLGHAIEERRRERSEEIGKRRVGKECRSRWSPYH